MQDIYNRVSESIMNFNSKLIVSAWVLIATLALLFIVFPILKKIWFKFCSKKDAEKSFLKKLENKRFLTFNQLLLIGVFASAFFLFWNINNPPEGKFNRISQSIIDSLRLFTIENDLDTFKSMFLNKEEPMNGLSNFYLSFFALLAPFCTVTAAVSLLFNDWFVQIKYYILPFRKAFVLSELNENSLCLAKDIRKNHPFSLIIFTGVHKNDSENDVSDFLGRVKSINAQTTKKSVTDFHYYLHFRPRIYLIDKEEKNNVKNGKVLYERYLKRKIFINVFSTLKSAEMFIDSLIENNKKKTEKKIKVNKKAKANDPEKEDKTKSEEEDKAKSKKEDKTKLKKKDKGAEINLINPAQIIAYDLLVKYPMFEAADACGNGIMNVLVVGAGYIGMECAKAAMWCGVMDSIKFKINIVDKTDRKEEFDSEFADFENNLSRVGKQINYRFHRVDFNETRFTNVLENCDEPNYIIVGLGDDEATINTYKKIRQFYKRKAIENDSYSPETEPVIIPIIRSKIYNDLLKDSKNDKFHPVGCNTEIYREKFIDEWFIENVSKQIHNYYEDGKKDNPYKNLSQTMKRSNRANAVHAIYKLRDMGVCLELTEKGSKTDEERKAEREKLDKYLDRPQNSPKKNALFNNEHIRWCVFQLLDGWVGVSTDKIKKVNSRKNGEYSQKIPDAKMHATIAKTENLKQIGLELSEDENKFTDNNVNVTKLIGSEIVKAIEKAYNKDVKINYK